MIALNGERREGGRETGTICFIAGRELSDYSFAMDADLHMCVCCKALGA